MTGDDDIHKTRTLIVIVGFMGSGKTTVAREFARLLNCHATDLDELIRKRAGRTSGEIIEQSSEDEFRRIETATLGQVLRQAARDVPVHTIALGGGTWALQRNRNLISKHKAVTVWLDAPFELCWERIKTGGIERPLARDERQARVLFVERRPLYDLAELHLYVGTHQSPAQICMDIIEALRVRTSRPC